jgi:stage II sporulation protein R
MNYDLNNSDIQSKTGYREPSQTPSTISTIHNTGERSKIHNLVHRNTPSPSSKEHFRTLLLIAILLICSLSALLVRANARHNQALQTGIAEDIIRFHVIANSDSDEDQKLKLIVRDRLVQELSPQLSATATLQEAKALISTNLEEIQALALQTIIDQGYNYTVKVTLEECYFPLKVYGSYTFPPGNYEALRVQIGKAEGKNWWCVMFPPLCFVDETYGIVDESSGEQLKNLLSEEEYAVLVDQKTPVKVKFKIVEMLKDLFN